MARASRWSATLAQHGARVREHRVRELEPRQAVARRVFQGEEVEVLALRLLRQPVGNVGDFLPRGRRAVDAVGRHVERRGAVSMLRFATAMAA